LLPPWSVAWFLDGSGSIDEVEQRIQEGLAA